MVSAEPDNAHLAEADLDAFVTDDRAIDLNAADRAMLDYVEKLTREPWAMREADVETLRGVDFDDNAILDICQVAAYYAFVNRLADGLGVELEAIHSSDQPDDAA